MENGERDGGRRRVGAGEQPLLPLLIPLLLDGQIPLPGQMVCLVIIREAGLDVVAPPDHHTRGCLLHRGHELMLLHPRPVAASQVDCLVHCEAQNGGSVT